ncbi:hypothetical protein FPV67DRAFT_1677806 [Lyophyllum atratum]|nr:hypothetical protein FPV67DRAFT_1677806 [Lyophyllum atratum]
MRTPQRAGHPPAPLQPAATAEDDEKGRKGRGGNQGRPQLGESCEHDHRVHQQQPHSPCEPATSHRKPPDHHHHVTARPPMAAAHPTTPTTTANQPWRPIAATSRGEHQTTPRPQRQRRTDKGPGTPDDAPTADSHDARTTTPAATSSGATQDPPPTITADARAHITRPQRPRHAAQRDTTRTRTPTPPNRRVPQRDTTPHRTPAHVHRVEFLTSCQ